MERQVPANGAVKIQGLLDGSSVVQYASSEDLDLILVVRMSRCVLLAQEGLTIQLDSTLDRRVDGAIDRRAELFDTAGSAHSRASRSQHVRATYSGWRVLDPVCIFRFAIACLTFSIAALTGLRCSYRI